MKKTKEKETIKEISPIEEIIEEPIKETNPIEGTFEASIKEINPIEETIEEPIKEINPIEETIEEPIKEINPIEETSPSSVTVQKEIVSKTDSKKTLNQKKGKLDLIQPDEKILVENVEELDFNLSGDDAKKNKTKVVYEYVAITPEGKKIKAYFKAHSKVEVHSYLISEGYKVISIKTSQLIQMLHSKFGMSGALFKVKDLIFFLAQLSTYLKSGIPLVDAIKILVKQFNKSNYKEILEGVVYDLTIGESFSESLAKQENAFPRLLINMIKASEMTGELTEALDDMEEYYTESESTRKAMVSAMIYPIIIFIVAITVGLFIMLYVVPKFVDIYEGMETTALPGITLFVLGLSNFLANYALYIGLGFILLIVAFIILYRKVQVFRKYVQLISMKLPGFGSIIIYNEVTVFTKTFASLLSHNVYITDSMEILNKVTGNEIYRELINEALENIAKGEKISAAFKNHWAFPIPAYEMIVTGEKTGQLAEMMKKVSDYYQTLHRNIVGRLKTFIEPVMIILLTVMVGVIVLSIIIPMFNMYSTIQQ